MPQIKDQSHGWTKSPGVCFFKHWISDVLFDSLLTFLWHLHCCHCCDSQNPMLQNGRQATSQSQKNIFRTRSSILPHTIQHVYKTHHKFRASKWLFPISWDLAKSCAAPWQSDTESCKWPNSRSLRASCVLANSNRIRHWKNIWGSDFS